MNNTITYSLVIFQFMNMMHNTDALSINVPLVHMAHVRLEIPFIQHNGVHHSFQH